MKTVTAKAHINIALSKYWGKQDVALVYPTTTSISFTLDKFYTITSIMSQAQQDEHTIIINDEVASPLDVAKVSRFLDYFSDGEKVKVVSKNYVPTKAGLASSASAYAALAVAANAYFEKHYSPEKLAQITRFGSGSASRSLFKNFVKWEANSDRISMIEAPIMKVGMFVIMIDASEKKLASREAMEVSKKTSWMYDAWVSRALKQAEQMEAALKVGDFHTLGSLAQDNAMGMHMTMMSSHPSIIYFQPQTIAMLHKLLELQAQSLDFYFTMDAGPNIKILVLEKDKAQVEAKLRQFVSADQLIYSSMGREAHLID